MADFMQFVFSGLTTGAIYALAALGFSLIYNASGVINFAQGDFLMLGAMVAAALLGASVPYGLAMVGGVVATVVVGLLLYRLAIKPAGEASVVSLIIITIGASIFIQGVVQIVLGKNQQILPSFSGDTSLRILGAYVLPQSLWVLGTAAVLVGAIFAFFRWTMVGKAMLAVAANKLAAQAVGIPSSRILQLSFGLSALLGALAGVVAAPITTTVYDIGLLLGMKGFVAATLGGLGNGLGAVVGGLIVGHGVGAIVLSLNLYASPAGRALRGLHGSEVAARMMGVDVARFKVRVFVASAVFAAVSGSLSAHYLGFISPSLAAFSHSVELATMVVLGGMASTFGAVLGAALLTALPQLLGGLHGYEMVFFGLLLMLTMIFLPRGLVPSIALKLARRR